MIYIYVLKLEENKYYVGKTVNPQFRLENHFESFGSSWTKKYKPIQVHELRPDQTNHDEQRITQEYMAKYGIDNVRGGPWCKIKLDTTEKEFIQKLISGEQDKCYQCGSGDHFAKDCPNKSVHCSKCGRYGHTGSSCYAKTSKTGTHIQMKQTIWTCKFCDKDFDSKRGCLFHENVHCLKRKGKTKYYDPAQSLVDELKDSSSEDEDFPEDDNLSVECFRCGRDGHYANTCYAKRHIQGYILS